MDTRSCNAIVQQSLGHNEPELHVIFGDTRRRRTGCLTCRKRRVRCDEAKPDCKNCLRKSRPCEWPRDGDKFKYHSLSTGSRNAAASGDLSPRSSFSKMPARKAQRNDATRPDATMTSDVIRLPTSAILSKSPRETKLSSPSEISTSDQSSASSRRGRTYSSQSTTSTNSLSADELSCWRSEVLQSYNDTVSPIATDLATSICRSQSARLKSSIDFEHESDIPPRLEPNAESFSDWKSLGASDVVIDALSDGRELLLLRTYLQQCAHWFDIVDGQRHYARKDVARMMSCPPWRAAALALSSKHMELTQGHHQLAEPLSLHLYQLAVQLAIDSISGRFDCVGTTAGCVVLAVYEMLTVTYHDWRRHLQGCTSIYSHNRWNGDSMGLIKASFWNYARIDTWAAYGAGTVTMLPTDKWFNNPETVLSRSCYDEDQHARIAIWLLARANNLIHAEPAVGHGTSISLQLQNDLSRWHDVRPPSASPIMEAESTDDIDNPFLSILFASESSAIACMTWHAAQVLLLEFEAKVDSSPRTSRIQRHARVVCGIVETQKASSSILIEAIHPLWICGRYLSQKAERFAILELLAQVERVIGWKTAWRAAGLHDYWSKSKYVQTDIS